MFRIAFLLGVVFCLACLTPVSRGDDEITSSSTAQASASASSNSSTTQTELMELVYNETSCGSELAGGYWPVEDLNSAELKAYSALALANYTKDNAADFLLPCQPDLGAAKNSIQVDVACKQVVAGTNYIIAFHVDFPCRTPGMQTLERELLANVFVPLLMSDNGSPQVTSIVAIES